ncbi:MAG: hypothetical protein WD069_12720, partial [Planctomycetales bacterium]
WRMEDGGWRMEDGGWRMEDGGASRNDTSRSPLEPSTLNLRSFRRIFLGAPRFRLYRDPAIVDAMERP